MRRILLASIAAVLCLFVTAAAQNTNPPAGSSSGGDTKPAAKRGPIFRANKEQIKQAQEILRQRSFYGGEATGKLDAATREGLRKYQEAEGLKVTGTLNAATLQKMNITLTERQKGILAAQQHKAT